MQSDALKILGTPRTGADRGDLSERLRGLLDIDPTVATPPYTIREDRAPDEIRIAFHGKVERTVVLALQNALCAPNMELRAVRVDVTATRDLNIRAIATLSMLCAALERTGVAAGLSGVPEKLRRDITRAQLHHLVNFE